MEAVEVEDLMEEVEDITEEEAVGLIKQLITKVEAIKREPIKVEAIKQESIKQEFIKREPIKREFIKPHFIKLALIKQRHSNKQDHINSLFLILRMLTLGVHTNKIGRDIQTGTIHMGTVAGIIGEVVAGITGIIIGFMVPSLVLS